MLSASFKVSNLSSHSSPEIIFCLNKLNFRAPHDLLLLQECRLVQPATRIVERLSILSSLFFLSFPLLFSSSSFHFSPFHFFFFFKSSRSWSFRKSKYFDSIASRFRQVVTFSSISFSITRDLAL